MKLPIMIVSIFCMLLFITTDTFGAVNISGELNVKYNFLNEAETLEGKVMVNGKINPNATAYFSSLFNRKATYGDPANPVITDTAKIDSLYIQIKPGYGTLTLGYFEHGTGNVLLIGNTIESLKSNLGIRYEMPVKNNYFFKLGYFNKEVLNFDSTNTFTAGMDYVSKKHGVGVHYVYPIDPLPPQNFDPSYILNAFVYPCDWLKVYIHAGEDEKQDQEQILGVLFLHPKSVPFFVNLEYNFDNIPVDQNLYGYRVGYRLAEGLQLYYTRTMREASSLSELRLHIIF